MGISVLPGTAIDADVAAGRLVRLPWRETFEVYTQLVWNARRSPSPNSGSLHGDHARDVSAARLASPVVPDRVARIGSKTNGQCVKHEQGGDNGDEDEKRFHHWLLQVPVEPS
jgi:hypothetical protein